MKLALVIPAHQEGAVIGATVRAAREAAPPGTLVAVVADHCADDTAARAEEAGAAVHRRESGPSGKGAALAWFLEGPGAGLADGDALLILDADSILRPGTVEALTAALETGAAAAQAFVWPVPATGSTASVWAAYSEWLSQAVGDRLRDLLGWPVPLRGTGTAVRVGVMRALAPRLVTKVEDAELSLLLAARGERIRFVSTGGVEDPKPSGTRGAVRQRARWLQGQTQLCFRHAGTLLRALLLRGPKMWSLASAILLKPKTLFILLKLAAAVAAWPWRGEKAGLAVLAVAGALLAKDVLLLGGGIFFAPRAWRGALLRALLLFPIYVGIWAGAAVLGLFSRDAWLRARE